ncbi:ATP-binding cassette domain-containing protein [Pectobacterium versatile]|uniref:ATP-binding cassette domain-containing protein n=1 Tax=Pectobacterium versatile TaxID=2488639 RepID=UPI001661081D|nr:MULTISPECIES: ATP-binding cassette domain-containing protein [Pectobacterium]MBK4825809.1 ABC transporter B family member [Pectobacterium carotovorum subsp. carotovorum]MCL6336774.1 ATP-binding cassette domain-containing protein [Pectobacterium carotovorum subsp. carotovorum]MCL6341030.1 ATP-binding cassette domain-containing protein [Pectobacterium carotovorum subsp. carotovorum]UNE77978.1 ATP-binding cassette domain-containing protein [Pectobacterium versatile]
MSEPIIELRAINKNYYSKEKGGLFFRAKQQTSVNALNNINLQIYPGEIFVIVGLSGSGKSTLLRTLNFLIPPTDGSVWFDGQELSSLSSAQMIALRRQKMGMVFQSFALFDERTVLDNVAFGLEVAGVSRATRYQKAQDMLEQVGLGQVANHYPHQLSGGMQQRVGLARALVVNPSVLLMDEAFSALDPIIRREMQSLLLTLQSQQRRTIVFVTHDMEEALRLGTRIAIMEQGNLVQVGQAETLINTPATPYVRHFFSGVDTSRWQLAESYADAGMVP